MPLPAPTVTAPVNPWESISSTASGAFTPGAAPAAPARPVAPARPAAPPPEMGVVTRAPGDEAATSATEATNAANEEATSRAAFDAAHASWEEQRQSYINTASTPEARARFAARFAEMQPEPVYRTMADTQTANVAAGVEKRKTETTTNQYDVTASPEFQALTPEAQQQALSNRRLDFMRNSTQGKIDQYQAGRDPYYAALAQSVLHTRVPLIQQQYTDALRSHQLAAAQRGLGGGSQDFKGQSDLRGAARGDVGRAQIAGQMAADAARAADQRIISDWRAHVESLTSGEQAASSTGTVSVADQQRAMDNYQNSVMQQMNNSQRAQNNRSQVTGADIQNVGTGIKNLAPAFARS